MSSSSSASESSSSSENVIWYSQVVLKETRRTHYKVRASMLLDLNIIDERWVLDTGPYDIEVGGTFGTVTIPPSQVRMRDGATFSIEFDRMGLTKETETIVAWQDTMLGRIRGALSLAREDGPFLFDPKQTEYRII